MSGLVSIIMPSYNTGKYIAESIKSVIAQTYPDWELLIVDDNSSDNTENVVKPFLSDNRIKFTRNSSNLGAALTRNHALQLAKGDWIAFLDSDDLWQSNKLEKQIMFMEKNSYAFSYTNYHEINEAGNITGVSVSGPRHIGKFGMYMFCWPGCLTVMYNAKQIGLIQIADIKKNNDYAMWLEIIKHSDCYLLEEDLAAYRKRSNSISRHGYLTLAKWHYKLYREAKKMGGMQSIVLTIHNLFWGAMKKAFYVSHI